MDDYNIMRSIAAMLLLVVWVLVYYVAMPLVEHLIYQWDRKQKYATVKNYQDWFFLLCIAGWLFSLYLIPRVV